MKKFFLFLTLFVLSFCLVSAVQVSTPKTDYDSGEMVTTSITECTGTSIVKFLNPSGSVVDISSGDGSWSMSYNTLSDSANGKYTISASCSDETIQKNFCVDDDGCTSSVAPEDDDEDDTDNGSGSSSGSGGGSSGSKDWNCGEWSYCGPKLTQTRTCTNVRNLQSTRQESRACSPCQESWVCSVWSQCSANAQARVCYDEHQCETTSLQPGLQKGCNQAEPFPPPTRISSQLPPPSFSGVAQQSFMAKLWSNYKSYIIGGAAVVLLAVLIVLAVHYLRPKRVAYNINELKQWVRKEKEVGTSDADIRQILKQHTGWTDAEVNMAFESLQQPSRSVRVSAI